MRDGYGRVYFKGKQEPAHRVAYVLFKGEIAKGQHVLHACDNRLCVNPAHLSAGSPEENVKDMDSKGRRGSKAVLSEREAEAVRHLLSQGVSQQQIADAWGIHQTTISRIKRQSIKHYRKE